jgi:hypothetical protein
MAANDPGGGPLPFYSFVSSFEGATLRIASGGAGASYSSSSSSSRAGLANTSAPAASSVAASYPPAPFAALDLTTYLGGGAAGVVYEALATSGEVRPLGSGAFRAKEATRLKGAPASHERRFGPRSARTHAWSLCTSGAEQGGPRDEGGPRYSSPQPFPPSLSPSHPLPLPL